MNYVYFTFILLLFSFTTTIQAFPPTNDDCSDAITLVVNTNLNCTSFSSGTVLDATDSGIADVCPGDYGDDVWFSFVATSSTHVISIQNIAGSTLNLNHQLYSGFCNNLVSAYCSDANSSVASNLAINKTYYVRVATETATAGQNTTFDICITTPPPPPVNDDCEGAIMLTMNPDLNCGSTTTGKVAGATASGNADICPGSYDDDVWFSFVATKNSHQISLININGSAVDLTHEVLAGACDAIFSVSCSDAETSSLGGLFVGETYFVRVATVTSTVGQNTTFNICVGEFPAAPSNDECTTATVLDHTNSCNPIMENIGSATDSGEPASACGGTPNDDMWYSFEASATNPTIEVNAVFDGIAELLDGSCGALNALDCIDLSTSSTFLPTNLVIGQTYFVRVYAFSAFTPTGVNAAFDICVYGGMPSNDVCTNATDILSDVLNEATFSGSTIGANDADAPVDNCTSIDNPGRGVWYVFTYNEATATTVTFTTAAGIRVYAYSGACGALTCVASGTGQGTNNCGIEVSSSNLVATTYYLYVSSAAGSAFSINVRSQSSLSVEWKQFSGYADGASNVLKWSTASETDLTGFTLQRSIAAQKDWTDLADIPSAGHASAGSDYQFEDKTPLAAAYYRLKWNDGTRKESFSNMIFIDRSTDNGWTVYPNPVQEVVYLSFESASAKTSQVDILQANGQLVQQVTLETQKGWNEKVLNVSDLKNGVYFIRWNSHGQSVVKKMVKF